MTSTFAPPTGPPVTGSPASAFHEPELAPAAAPSPRGRRRGFALVAAAGAVLALGLAALVAFAGSGSDDGADVAEPYSLIAAAENTITARTVEFDLTVSASDLVEVTVSGAVDNESQLVSVTTDLSSLLALGDTPIPFGGGDMTVLVDGSTVVADDAYLTRAIADPSAELVDGYTLKMPANNLSDAEVADIVAFIETLADG